MFVTVFTTAWHLSLSWARSIQTICLVDLFKIHFSITLSSRPRSPKWHLSFRFPHKTPVCNSSLPYVLHALFPHSSWGLPITKIYILPSSPVPCHVVPHRSNIGSDFFLSNRLFNSFSLCSAFNIRNQVSHPYKSTGKIRFLYILKFIFPESQSWDQTLWTERLQTFPQSHLLLIYSGTQIWLVRLFYKYLEFAVLPYFQDYGG